VTCAPDPNHGASDDRNASACVYVARSGVAMTRRSAATCATTGAGSACTHSATVGNLRHVVRHAFPAVSTSSSGASASTLKYVRLNVSISVAFNLRRKAP
jgi:hypothetical protein